ncbi:MAG TPA: flp pilus-assembly TadE/G-like family protein [Candidatus Stackebrandtia excrementipullorum]|nr:flp pilus-assembly TadE/G-like family protein [Candidatus Stackebrandtia excrementipullorum]
MEPRGAGSSRCGAVGDGRDLERGGVSVVLLAVGLAIMMVGLTAVTVGSVIHARHRAQVGADAAALAGAMRMAEGAPAVCDRASELAEANSTSLSGCAVHKGVVVVRTEAWLPKPLHRWGPIAAAAAAEPMGAAPDTDGG